MTISKEEMLLSEYTEAGLITRQHEELTRRSLNLYLVVASALIGAIQFFSQKNINVQFLFLLETVGFLYGLMLFNTVLRSRQYYRIYIERAKTIEKELKHLDLYNSGNREFKKTKVASLTITNKQAIGALLIIPSVFFFISAMRHAFCWGSGAFSLVLFVLVLAIDYYLITVLAESEIESSKKYLFGEVVVAMLLGGFLIWLVLSNWQC